MYRYHLIRVGVDTDISVSVIPYFWQGVWIVHVFVLCYPTEVGGTVVGLVAVYMVNNQPFIGFWLSDMHERNKAVNKV